MFMRLNELFHKHWKVLLGLVIIYFTIWHYFFLGYISWDGFVFRIPPIIEFLQHGEFPLWKFDTIYAQHASPFFEFLHLPFLYFGGLPGLFFSFSVVLLPLATISVYLFAQEVTSDHDWALYTALSFLALPFVNEQPFAGYRDFAVVGALALFLFSLLRINHESQPSLKEGILLLSATLLFSFSRQHTPYIALLLFFVIQSWFFLHGKEEYGRVFRAKMFFITLGIVLIGLFPSLLLQGKQFLLHGSPIYPYQFQAFGIQSETGVPMTQVLKDGGLLGLTWKDMGSSFMQGWIWVDRLPSEFYDSRSLGVGLSCWVLLISLPILFRHLNGFIFFLIGTFIAISILVQDFWLPRFSMTLILGLCLLLGGTFSFSIKYNRIYLYGFLMFFSLFQLFGRPAFVAASILNGNTYYSRANLANSSFFLDNSLHVMEIYPNWNADLVVSYPLANHYVLSLYGQHLSNHIVATFGKDSPVTEQVCQSLNERASYSNRRVILIDHIGRLAKPCKFQCLPEPWGCLAYEKQQE